MKKQGNKPLKVALACDWLTEIGGAEQVLKTLHEMFPEAPIYTSQYRHKVDSYFGNRETLDVRTGWLNHLPAATRRFIAPLRQSYFSHLDLTEYDLVISVTGCDAKYVKTQPGSHLCYCHVPTQYYWGKYQDYLKNPGFGILNPIARLALKILVPHLRKKDLEAAARPDYYVTISSYAACEIKKYYKREARVINPPVRIELFQQLVENSAHINNIKAGKNQTKKTSKSTLCQINNTMKTEKSQTQKSEQNSCTLSTHVENSANTVRFLAENRGKYYINFSRQVNWKHLDILIEACIQSHNPLVLIGDGPEHKKLVKLAQKLERQNRTPSNSLGKKSATPDSPLETVLFLPAMSQSELLNYLENAKAFLFPSEEPFGIAPVEALAAGCPVIALKSGGALDFIQDGKNGLFFAAQKTSSLIKALKRFDKSPLSRRRKTTISNSVTHLSEASFNEKMLQYIHEIKSS